MGTNKMRKTTEQERDVFLYLNALRESGLTNMYGASTYIINEFGASSKDARKLLILWMSNFSEEGNYDEIEE